MLRGLDTDPGSDGQERRPVREADPLTELVGPACAGDVAAIRRLVDALAPGLARPVRMILGPRHPDLEDVLQECLYQVLRALPSFRGDASVKHFAHVITAKRAVEARRRWATARAQRERYEQVAGATAETVAPPQGDGERVQRLLAALLDELPEPQFETVSLRFFLGLSIEEIARATDVPANTVRSRLRLAKDHLRARIEADDRLSPLREVAS